MRFNIVDFEGETVEEFDASGHRPEVLESIHLDALKLAAAWGYTAYPDDYAMFDADGNSVALVDPYGPNKWRKEIARDFAHIGMERGKDQCPANER